MPRKFSFLVSGFGIVIISVIAFFDSYAQSIPHIGTFEFFSHVYNLVSLLVFPFIVGGVITILIFESISWQYMYTSLLAQYLKRFVVTLGNGMFLHRPFASLSTGMYTLTQNGYHMAQAFLLYGTRAILSFPILLVMFMTMPLRHIGLYMGGAILYTILMTSVFQLWMTTSQAFQARNNAEIIILYWKQRSFQYYLHSIPRILVMVVHEILAPVCFGIALTAVVFSAIPPDSIRLLFGFPFEGAIVAVLFAFFPFDGIIGFVLMFGMYQLHHNIGTVFAFMAASLCWQMWFSPQLLKTIPHLRRWLCFALISAAVLGWAVNLYGM